MSSRVMFGKVGLSSHLGRSDIDRTMSVREHVGDKEKSCGRGGASAMPNRVKGVLARVFLSGREGIQSMWDTSDISLGWKRTKGVICEDDLRRLSQLLSSNFDTLLVGDLAKAMSHHVASLEEAVGRSEATVTKSTEEWKVAAFGAFKALEAFDEMVMDEAIMIYDQNIRDCRCVMRESGSFLEEDMRLLGPKILDNEGVKIATLYNILKGIVICLGCLCANT
ncbi:hypothetical protein Pfo_026724 [Paulownia fortunei]|nr:hypothetical protein Pfo_026724 [Paulownia fortunei]